jgi:hypothetical protein
VYVEIVDDASVIATGDLRPFSVMSTSVDGAFLQAQRAPDLTGVSGKIAIVENSEDIDRLMAISSEDRPLAALTNVVFVAQNTTFPVIYVNNDFARFASAGELRLRPEYRCDAWAGLSGADFSSRGPGANGVIKPDVIAPGYGVLSARSVPDGTPNHDLTPLAVQPLDGTSAAAASVAGSAALVTDYIVKKFKFSPSSSLVRAVIVTAADPLSHRPFRSTQPRGAPASRW